MSYGHQVIKALVPFGYDYQHKLYLEFRIRGADFKFSISWVDKHR